MNNENLNKGAAKMKATQLSISELEKGQAVVGSYFGTEFSGTVKYIAEVTTMSKFPKFQVLVTLTESTMFDGSEREEFLITVNGITCHGCHSNFINPAAEETQVADHEDAESLELTVGQLRFLLDLVQKENQSLLNHQASFGRNCMSIVEISAMNARQQSCEVVGECIVEGLVGSGFEVQS